MKYDVVIVGAGLGGLCAGALLSLRGYKTLVVESQDRLGGNCSTEEVEGFKLTTGAIGIHRGGVIDEVYKKAGAKLELVDASQLWFRIEGKDYEMPPKGAIKAFLEIINKLEVNRGRLVGHIAKEVAIAKLMGVFRKGVMGQEKTDEMTFRDWLLQHTDNELAHQTFDAFAITLLGLHINELPASQMFSLFSKVGGWREIGIAPKGNAVNAESLANVIMDNNGDVWANCPAKQIIVRNGKAEGVIVQKNGQEVEIAGQAVISNAGPKKTVDLAGDKNFDNQYLGLLQADIGSLPMIFGHVASDVPLCLEDGEPGSMIIVGARRLYGIFPLTNMSPDLAPPGQHLLYCLGAPLSHTGPKDVGEEIEQSILDLKEQFPKFEKHGRILKMEVIHLDWPRLGRNIPQKTPVENLYNVGDDVTPPNSIFGCPGAVDSAKYVTEIVKKRIKPQEN